MPVTGRGGGSKGGGSSSRAPVESPNTLRARSTARVIDLVSEGEIVGLADGNRSIFLDDTPLQNADGTYNFQNFGVDFRAGLPDQEPVPGFAEVEAESPVGAQVTVATPIVRAITDTDADAVRVTVQVPALQLVDTSTGDQGPTSVTFRIDVQPNGGSYAAAKTVTIQGKTVSPYAEAHRVELPEGQGPWNVRLTRLTSDSGSSSLQNDLYWSSYTVIKDFRLIYPNTAYFALAADAQAFGGRVPARAYDILGRIIEVPVNYDPETRSYSGIWNGTFKQAWSDNPAWIFRDIVVNDVYGLGEFIKSNQIDKFSLYEISRYCDELVPDGQGGMEPRYTFNGALKDREEAIRTLVALAGVFLGMVHMAAGSIIVSADQPADAVKLVAPANVIDGDFKYEGSGLKSQHTVALVTWHDPDDGYRPAIEVHEDADLIERLGYRPLEITAVGCTSRGQAARMGRWAIDTERYGGEAASYRASWDHADVAPGDIIKIADPAYAGVRFGGRIAAVIGSEPTITGVTLDDEIMLDGDESYMISLIMPDKSVIDAAVSNGPGVTGDITFATPIATAPLVGAMWIMTGSDVEPRQFRVIAMREVERHIFEISAIFHDTTKYARIEQGIFLESPRYTTLPTGPIAAPSDLRISEYLYRAGDITARAAVTLSWTASRDTRVLFYEVQIKPPLLEWQPVDTTAQPSIDVRDIASGLYGFRVRAVDGGGRPSAWATLDPVRLDALMAPPDDVDGFSIAVVGDLATLSWSPVANLNLSHYVIRFTPETGGATWNGSAVLLPMVNSLTVQVPSRRGTYLIKAVTQQGAQSVNAALIVTDVDSILALNVVDSIVAQDDWTGVFDDTEAAGGSLRLASVDSMADWPSLASVQALSFGTNGLVGSGTFTDGETLDLGEVYTSRVTPILQVYGDSTLDVIANWTSLAEVASLSAVDASQWSAVIELRTTNDDPAGAPTWSPWQEARLGDYSARAFQMRVLLTGSDGAVTPIVSRAELLIDMPDRVVAGDDLLVSVSGRRVAFTPAFKGFSGLSRNDQNLSTGDYAVVTNIDTTGFDIIYRDSSGAPVERSFDFVAKGYGRVTI